MKMILLTVLTSIFFFTNISAFAADQESASCKGSKMFTGAIHHIQTGACAGHWAIEFDQGYIVPNNLPAQFQRDRIPVWGCYVEVKSQGCEVEGQNAAIVSLKKIIPSYE